MSKVICERQDLVNIADAVRNKSGATKEMTLTDIYFNLTNFDLGNNGKALITSVPSEDNTSITFIDENGDLKAMAVKDISSIVIPAPQVVLVGTYSSPAHYNSRLSSIYVGSVSTMNSAGYTGYVCTGGVSPIHLDSGGNVPKYSLLLVMPNSTVTFEYVAADNEPV